MKTLRDKRIFRMLCRDYKTSSGLVNWSKVTNELLKLPSYKKKHNIKNKACEKCGK